MSSVKSLSVSGYKSIKELKDFKLNNLNVLIGANGAGKSNFIGLFRLLNEMYEGYLQLFVQRQGGPDALLHFGRKASASMYAQFNFGDNAYKFDLIPTNDNRLIFEDERCLYFGPYHPDGFERPLGSGHEQSKLPETTHTIGQFVKASINQWRVYHFHDTSETARVKQAHGINDNLVLKPDAANLAAYLRMLKTSHALAYERIVQTIRLVAPFFDDFVHRDTTAQTIELEWKQVGNSDTPFKAHLLSDGTLRFMCLCTLLLQPIELVPDTLLIDEPELGLHPYAISILVAMLKQASQQRQLIVSSQSVELVSELAPEDVVVVGHVNGASTFERFTQDELEHWLAEYNMGELWKQNVLGGRP